MIAARKGSPLAIGYGEGEMFVGSDAIALAPMTDRISYLEEGDRAIITRTSVEIIDANGALANRAIKTIQIDSARIDKAGTSISWPRRSPNSQPYWRKHWAIIWRRHRIRLPRPRH